MSESIEEYKGYKLRIWTEEKSLFGGEYRVEEVNKIWHMCSLSTLLALFYEAVDSKKEGNKINNILWVDYKEYKLKIFLDAERNCLVGEVDGINGWYDSDSLTHLKEQLERPVDEKIG